MEFYLFISLFTSLFFYISVSYEKKNKGLNKVLLLLYILVPSIVGGLRNPDVGTDMNVYGNIYFYNACQSNDLYSFIKNLDSHEYGYHLLNWFCSRVSTDINFFMFIAELLKIIFVGLTAWRFRIQMNTFLFVLAYMLFFWCSGLSYMRQSLALCTCLYSLVYFFDKNYIKYILLMILGYFFHNSAIIMMIVPFILFLSTLKKRLIISTFIAVAVFLSATFLFSFIANSGLFAESKGELYLNSGVDTAKTNILIVIIFLLSTFLLKIRNIDLCFMIQSCSIFCLMFLLLAPLFEVAFRASYYPMLPLLIIVPIAINNLNGFQKTISEIIFVLLFILHFIILANHGLCGTIPYESAIFESLFI